MKQGIGMSGNAGNRPGRRNPLAPGFSSQYGSRVAGLTLVELLVVMAVVGILLAVGIPSYGSFAAKNRARSAATLIMKEMNQARMMAIKENRRYLLVADTANGQILMGFDGNGDDDLADINNDGYGLCACVDADSDGYYMGAERVPTTDADGNSDSIPDCVRFINLEDFGRDVVIGYASGTTPPNGPNATVIPASGENWGGTPPSLGFGTDGSSTPSSLYIQELSRGFSYCVRIRNNAGSTDLWLWDGDADNPTETAWRIVR